MPDVHLTTLINFEKHHMLTFDLLEIFKMVHVTVSSKSQKYGLLDVKVSIQKAIILAFGCDP